MQNRKFNNPKKECKTLKNIEKKTGWVPGAPHKTDPRADPPDEPNRNDVSFYFDSSAFGEVDKLGTQRAE